MASTRDIVSLAVVNTMSLQNLAISLMEICTRSEVSHSMIAPAERHYAEIVPREVQPTFTVQMPSPVVEQGRVYTSSSHAPSPFVQTQDDRHHISMSQDITTMPPSPLFQNEVSTVQSESCLP